MCKAYQNSQEIWDLLQTLKPVMVLISLPTDEDSHVGAMYYRNKQTPVMWLREEDGHGLCAALTAAPEKAIRVLAMPGAELVAVKDEYAGQPAITSALGPVRGSCAGHCVGSGHDCGWCGSCWPKHQALYKVGLRGHHLVCRFRDGVAGWLQGGTHDGDCLHAPPGRMARSQVTDALNPSKVCKQPCACVSGTPL